MRRTLSILVIVLTLLLLTTAAAHARPNECATICHHVVRPGETIYCIARAYGVDPCAIAAQNGIVNPNRLRPGQVLAIPDVYKTLPPGPTCARQCDGHCDPCPPPCHPCPHPCNCTCVTHHTVACGQNLYRISLQYGVSMWHIAHCNGIANPNYIRWGTVLCIPAGP
jgi:peptidoglycan endopeptidase LytF